MVSKRRRSPRTRDDAQNKRSRVDSPLQEEGFENFSDEANAPEKSFTYDLKTRGTLDGEEIKVCRYRALVSDGARTAKTPLTAMRDLVGRATGIMATYVQHTERDDPSRVRLNTAKAIIISKQYVYPTRKIAEIEFDINDDRALQSIHDYIIAYHWRRRRAEPFSLLNGRTACTCILSFEYLRFFPHYKVYGNDETQQRMMDLIADFKNNFSCHQEEFHEGIRAKRTCFRISNRHLEVSNEQLRDWATEFLSECKPLEAGVFELAAKVIQVDYQQQVGAGERKKWEDDHDDALLAAGERADVVSILMPRHPLLNQWRRTRIGLMGEIYRSMSPPPLGHLMDLYWPEQPRRPRSR